jgi:excisionase family DNA binding protein
MNETRTENAASDLMTVKEVCPWLRLSKTQLYGMAGRGEITHIKLGSKMLFHRKDIQEFIRRNTRPAHAPFEGEGR